MTDREPTGDVGRARKVALEALRVQGAEPEVEPALRAALALLVT